MASIRDTQYAEGNISRLYSSTATSINFTVVESSMNISEIGTRAFENEKEIPLGVRNFSNFLVRIANCL